MPIIRPEDMEIVARKLENEELARQHRTRTANLLIRSKITETVSEMIAQVRRTYERTSGNACWATVYLVTSSAKQLAHDENLRKAFEDEFAMQATEPPDNFVLRLFPPSSKRASEDKLGITVSVKDFS